MSKTFSLANVREAGERLAKRRAQQYNDQGIAGNLLDVGQRAMYNTGAGVAETFGWEGGADWLKERADDQLNDMSLSGRQAYEKEIFTRDDNGNLTLGDGASDAETWLYTLAEGIVSTGATMALGGGVGLAGRGVTGMAKLAKSKVFDFAKRKGLNPNSPQVKALADRAAHATSKKALERLATAKSLGGDVAKFGTAAHAVSGGQTALDVRHEIEAMDWYDLEKVPEFVESVRRLAREQPELLQKGDEVLLEAAKDEIKQQAYNNVMTNPALLTSNMLLGGLGDMALKHILTGAIKNKLTTGVVSESVTEAGQSAIEQVAANQVRRDVLDADVDLFKDADLAAAVGGVTGAGVGGSFAAAGKAADLVRGKKGSESLPNDGESLPADADNLPVGGKDLADTFADVPAGDMTDEQRMDALAKDQKARTANVMGKEWDGYNNSRYSANVKTNSETGEQVLANQPAFVMTKDGSPFKTEQSAKSALAKLPVEESLYKVSAIDGGFVLERTQPAKPLVEKNIAKGGDYQNKPSDIKQPSKLDLIKQVDAKKKEFSAKGNKLDRAAFSKLYKILLSGKNLQDAEPLFEYVFGEQFEHVKQRDDNWHGEYKQWTDDLRAEFKHKGYRVKNGMFDVDMDDRPYPKTALKIFQEVNNLGDSSEIVKVGESWRLKQVDKFAQPSAPAADKVNAPVMAAHSEPVGGEQQDVAVDSKLDHEDYDAALQQLEQQQATDNRTAHNAYMVDEFKRQHKDNLAAEQSSEQPAEIKLTQPMTKAELVKRMKPLRKKVRKFLAIQRSRLSNGERKRIISAIEIMDKAREVRLEFDQQRDYVPNTAMADALAKAKPTAAIMADPEKRAAVEQALGDVMLEENLAEKKLVPDNESTEQVDLPASDVNKLESNDGVQSERKTDSDGNGLEQGVSNASPPTSDVKRRHEGRELDSTQEPVERGDDSNANAISEGAAETVELINAKSNEAATSELNDRPDPTDAQKLAGNYKKGHIKVHGLDISIENPKGSVRSGVAANGEQWQNTMAAHYGDIKGTKGADGDPVDVFVGSTPESPNVWVIDQVNPNSGKFDEHKVMLGFGSAADAKEAYLNSYDADWQGLGDFSSTNVDDFKTWLNDADTTKPYAADLSTDSVDKPVDKPAKAKENKAVNNSPKIDSADELENQIAKMLVDYLTGRNTLVNRDYLTQTLGKFNASPTADFSRTRFIMGLSSYEDRKNNVEPYKKQRKQVALIDDNRIIDKALELAKSKDLSKDKLKQLETELADKKKAAAAELADLFKQSRGTLGSGADPKILLATAKLGAYTVAEGTVKFANWVRDVLAFARNAGISDEQVKPYLKKAYGAISFDPEGSDLTHEQVENMQSPKEVAAINIDELISELDNVSATSSDVEPDSQKREDSEPEPKSADDDGSGRVGQDAKRAGAKVDKNNGRDSGDSVPVSDGAVPRKASADGLYQPDGAVKLDGGVERAGKSGRGDSASPDGLQAKQPAANATKAVAQQLEPVAEPAKPAFDGKLVFGNVDNIHKSLPMLLPQQAQDIVHIENRLFGKNGVAAGTGYLNTNGTGTGKTFVGLGTIKRFALAGKDNVLVVVPSSTIAKQWQKTAKDFFDIDAHVIGDNGGAKKADAGQGVTLVTYATLGNSRPLIVERGNWDLVVADESHSLMSGQDAKATEALQALRAITQRGGNTYGRAKWFVQPEQDALTKAKDAYRAKLEQAGELSKMQINEAVADKFRAQQQALDKQLKDKRDEYAETVPDTKVLMLSATPFAYVKNLEYAEGYLFDYAEYGEKHEGGYDNAFHGHNAFYIENFGYKWRHHRLEQPDGRVDSGLMERKFHEKLKKQGRLGGRSLEVDRDYNRTFSLVPTAAGEKLDRVIELWRSDAGTKAKLDGLTKDKASSDKIEAAQAEYDAKKEMFSRLSAAMKKVFDYHNMVKLTEAVKAEQAAKDAKALVAQGKKVVIFHTYNVGGSFNPLQEVAAVEPALFREFAAQYPDMVNIDFGDLRKPLDVFANELGEQVGFFNGNVTEKQRAAVKDDFNDDNGTVKVLVVQQDAGNSGISLHDTTGKSARVLLNIGIPVKPTLAIQIEGRIYRIGVLSDALFNYYTTGTNFERNAFADKISDRASTAENLGMGDKARRLKASFAEGYLDADVRDVTQISAVGGKLADNPVETSEWDEAKTFYWSNLKRNSKTKSAEGSDYFATPEPLGLKMVEWLQPKAGDRLLEPSIGHGAIGRFFPADTVNKAVEPSMGLASKARLVFGGDVVDGDFESLNKINKFEGIVMNPPFGVGGKLAYEHVEKALGHLVNGGRVVALVPDGNAANKRLDKLLADKKHNNIHQAAEILLPAGTFARAGTGVVTKILVLDKFNNAEDAATFERVDLRDVKDAEALFDEIEHLDLLNRPEPTDKPDPADFMRVKMRKRKVKGQEVYPLQFYGYLPMAQQTLIDQLLTDFGAVPKKDFVTYEFSSEADRGGFADLAAKVLADAVESGVELNLTKPTNDEAEAEPAAVAGVDKNEHFEYSGDTYTTKKGNRLNHVTKMLGRQEYDVYKKLKDIASDLGGWARGQNFMFEDLDALKEFNAVAGQYLDGLSTGDSDSVDIAPALRPADGVASMGDAGNVGIAEASAIIKRIDASLLDRGNGTTLVKDFAALKQRFGDKFTKQQLANLKNAAGFLHDGRVVINLSHVKTPLDLELLYIHERLRHFGFRQLFGEDMFNDFSKIYHSLGDKKIRELAERYNLPFDDYVSYYQKLGRKHFKGELLDEVLAHIEPNDVPKRAFEQIRQLLTKLKLWLHKHGFEGVLGEFGRYNEQDLFSIIQLAEKGLKTNKKEVVKLKQFDLPPSLSTVAGSKAVLNLMESAASKAKTFDYKEAMAKAWSASKKLRRPLLSLLPLRYLADWAKDLTAVKTYLRIADRMQAYRNERLTAYEKTLDNWRELMGDKVAAKDTADLMHDATIDGVDAGDVYKPLLDNRKYTPDGRYILIPEHELTDDLAITPEYVKERVKVLKEVMRSRPDDAPKIMKRIKDLEIRLKQELKRKQAYPALRKRFLALPKAAQDIYIEVRDQYRKQQADTDKALIQRIERLHMGDKNKGVMVQKLREQFEQARVAGVYFPLQRFGDYWALLKDADGVVLDYQMFDSEFKQQKYLAENEGKGVLDYGKKIESAKLLDAVDPVFVAEVNEILDGLGYTADAQRDEIYQLYLQRIPELSNRKHFIHRKGTAGFSDDALRAYAQNMFHGAYQLSKLEYSDRLAAAIKDATEQVKDSKDKNHAADVVSELKARHEWLLNPRSATWANKASGFAFVWYLGLTPAAALTNLVQTPVVAFPVLASRYGFKAAAAELLAASKLFAKGGHVDKHLSGHEAMAFKQFQKSGLIEKTLAHDFAGIADNGAEYNPTAHKAMQKISYLFHHAERYNREVTALAAYRLAKKQGRSHGRAVQLASDLTYEAHFDYSSANKSRFLQNDLAKVAFIFRQYSLNMSYRMGRDFALMFKGETPKVKREARRQFWGMMGMASVFAGAMGTPILAFIGFIAEMIEDEEDEPFVFETEFRSFMADMLGETGGDIVSKGLVNQLGFNIADRVSLANLWLRENDRDYEGQDAVKFYAEQLLGPIFGLALSGGFAMDMYKQGQYGRMFESMSPKVVKDVLRAGRYLDEGVQNLNGAQVTETHIGHSLSQALGFVPTSVAEQYDLNSARKQVEQRVLRRRALLMNKYAFARRNADADLMKEVSDDIRAFNENQPAVAISKDTLNRSWRMRERHRNDSANGVSINKKLADQVNEIRF